MAQTSLALTLTLRMLISAALLGALIFWPAGTFSFVPGWLFLGVLFSGFISYTLYFVGRDDDFLKRRMQMEEKETVQQRLIKSSAVIFLGAFVLPGFDHRYGWSQIPLLWVIVANAFLALSFVLQFWVFYTNRYAARTVEIQEGQELVKTGPYAIVRHPQYASLLVFFFAMPFALGTYWLLPVSLLSVLMFHIRIKNEEQVLREGLPGYTEYCEEVRFKMIPYVY